METRSVYLGTFAYPTAKRPVAELRSSFSRLTPALLSLIPENVIPKTVRDRIVLPEQATVHLPVKDLAAALAKLSPATPIIEAEAGSEFHLLTPPLQTLADAVPVMIQALSENTRSVALSTNENSPVRIAITAGTKKAVSHRGVTAWLDGITHPTNKEYENEAGIFMRIGRLYGSFLDHATIWIPLGIQIADTTQA